MRSRVVTVNMGGTEHMQRVRTFQHFAELRQRFIFTTREYLDTGLKISDLRRLHEQAADFCATSRDSRVAVYADETRAGLFCFDPSSRLGSLL